MVWGASAFPSGASGGGEAEGLRPGGAPSGMASLIPPLLLGIPGGGVGAGAVGGGGRGMGDGFVATYVRPWLNPFTLSVGLFALVAFAFLAAVYLTLEAREQELEDDFRRRALGAGVALFCAAAVALLLSRDYAPPMREGLIFAARAGPLHLLTAACAVTALAAPWVRRLRLAPVAP